MKIDPRGSVKRLQPHTMRNAAISLTSLLFVTTGTCSSKSDAAASNRNVE